MDPIFSLPYAEYAVANQLANYFKHSKGYSLFLPLSRQEKGIDLVLIKRNRKLTKIITIQVKASRTYSPKPPKKGNSKRYSFYTWFNRFTVQDNADLFVLIGLYPPIKGRSKKMSNWWDSIILVFNNKEMIDFLKNVKTKKGSTDKMFGFGFDNKDDIFQTRGDKNREFKNYSDYLLKNRIDSISNLLK